VTVVKLVKINHKELPMNFQSSLTALAGAFVAFYIACVSIGRADIPFRLITEFRYKAIVGTTASWGVSVGVAQKRL
jgi:hypothetical protein